MPQWSQKVLWKWTVECDQLSNEATTRRINSTSAVERDGAILGRESHMQSY